MSNFLGDSGTITVFSGGTASPEGNAVLQRQWVTLTAGMWPPSEASSTQPLAPPTGRLPVLAAVFCGAALVVALTGACLLYWCCVMPRKDNKHYCKFMTMSSPCIIKTNNTVVGVTSLTFQHPFPVQKYAFWDRELE